LGAQRPPHVQRRAAPLGLSGRRLHRLPRLLEPGAISPRRLQCRVPAALRRRAFRQVCDLCRRVRRSRERSRSGGAPAFGRGFRPDGALYISDDQHGRIWRVTFQGNIKTTGIAPAPSPSAEDEATGSIGGKASPPEGIHPDAGSDTTGSLPIPSGQTHAQVALGDRIFHGQGGATCAGCHGSNAKGTPLAPDLTDNKWLWGDGSVPSIAETITDGVPNPKDYHSGMPPMGGDAQLSPTDVLALADYVWALSQRKE
jgi:mono/diheme cytochrome c family protein